MPPVTTPREFMTVLQRSELVELGTLRQFVERFGPKPPQSPRLLADELVREGLITEFHATQLLQGRSKGFFVGKYKVLDLIGTGGMGKVYLAEHVVMKRPVALKLLPKSKIEDEAARRRFQREARAIAAMSHPNIVQAYDIDTEGKEVHYIVMEFVAGLNVQDFVRFFGPLAWGQAAFIVSQVCGALEHAAKIGITHRDIKPSNILVDYSGIVKLLDLGLAVFHEDKHEDGPAITIAYKENVLGTADYLAPEQAVDSHNVDIRADIYALGASFYYMVVGEPPFPTGSVAQKLIYHQTRQPRPIHEFNPEVPDELVAIIQRMMAKKVEDRFQTPAEVATALDRYAERFEPPYTLDLVRKVQSLLAFGTEESIALAHHLLRSASDQRAMPAQPARSPSSPISTHRSASAASSSSASGTKATGSGSIARPAKPAPVVVEAVLPEHLIDEDNPEDWEPELPPSRGFWSEVKNAWTQADGLVESMVVVLQVGLLPPYRTGFIASVCVGFGFLFTLSLYAISLMLMGADNRPLPIPRSSLASITLRVSAKDQGEGIYNDLASALAVARSGQIVSLDAGVFTVDTLELGEKLLQSKADDILIDGKTKDGLATLKAKGSQPIIRIHRCKKLELRDLILDGNGSGEPLMEILGNQCEQLNLHNVQFRNYARLGMRLSNVTAIKQAPIRLENLQFWGGPNNPVGCELTGEPKSGQPTLEWIQAKSFWFVGGHESAIEIAQRVDNLRLTSLIVYQANTGLRVSVPDCDLLTVTNGTFVDVQAALRYEVLPTKTHYLTNNYFDCRARPVQIRTPVIPLDQRLLLDTNWDAKADGGEVLAGYSAMVVDPKGSAIVFHTLDPNNQDRFLVPKGIATFESRFGKSKDYIGAREPAD